MKSEIDAQARALLRATATWFEAHPERWVQGFPDGEMVCAGVQLSRTGPGTVWLVAKRLADAEAQRRGHSGLVGYNDRIARSVRDVIDLLHAAAGTK